MKESTAYRIAIAAVIADHETGDDEQIDALKVLFRSLHYAEKREQEYDE